MDTIGWPYLCETWPDGEIAKSMAALLSSDFVTEDIDVRLSYNDLQSEIPVRTASILGFFLKLGCWMRQVGIVSQIKAAAFCFSDHQGHPFGQGTCS